jgi:hypothetical protein
MSFHIDISIPHIVETYLISVQNLAQIPAIIISLSIKKNKTTRLQIRAYILSIAAMNEKNESLPDLISDTIKEHFSEQ